MDFSHKTDYYPQHNSRKSPVTAAHLEREREREWEKEKTKHNKQTKNYSLDFLIIIYINMMYVLCGVI